MQMLIALAALASAIPGWVAPDYGDLPPDLAKALNSDPEVKAAFDRLPYGLKRKEVAAIEEAKTPETRQRRISKLLTRLRSERP